MHGSGALLNIYVGVEKQPTWTYVEYAKWRALIVHCLACLDVIALTLCLVPNVFFSCRIVPTRLNYLLLRQPRQQTGFAEPRLAVFANQN